MLHIFQICFDELGWPEGFVFIYFCLLRLYIYTTRTVPILPWKVGLLTKKKERERERGERERERERERGEREEEREREREREVSCSLSGGQTPQWQYLLGL